MSTESVPPGLSLNGEITPKIEKLFTMIGYYPNADSIVLPILMQKPLPPTIEVSERTAATGLDRAEIIRCLKYELPKTGLGTFKTGRRHQPSRFIWGLAERAAVEYIYGNIRNSKSLPTEPAMAPEPIIQEPNSIGLLEHQFQLRLGHTVHLQLPSDLTQTEAQRLAEFIKTLPFN